jgi:hypothetical protein
MLFQDGSEHVVPADDLRHVRRTPREQATAPVTKEDVERLLVEGRAKIAAAKAAAEAAAGRK